jgi:capsular polysaccharide transport system permease protein
VRPGGRAALAAVPDSPAKPSPAVARQRAVAAGIVPVKPAEAAVAASGTSDPVSPAPVSVPPAQVVPAAQAAPAPSSVQPAGAAAAKPVPAAARRSAQAVSAPGAARPVPVEPEKADPSVPATPAPDFLPAAQPARLHARHWLLAASFLVMVMLPLAAAAWYLYARAVDEYASTVAFSVRREEQSSALEIFGGLSALSGSSSSSDTDVLYEFLQSQKLVEDLNAQLDLRGLWSGPRQQDPVFAFDPSGTIEDLVKYWNRMVQVNYDSASGLIEVRVLAFTSEDATRIAQGLFDQSASMVNDLSAVAREDAIGYARDDLEAAEDRLKVAREAVTVFRNKNQIIDPALDLQSQAGLLGTLQGQLAETLIELDLMRETASASDPRMTQLERRVEVIKSRIAAERDKLGIGVTEAGDKVYADIVAEYERLTVDREFAEKSYVSALAAYDAAKAEARRKSRYLAAHVLPTKAESSRYPERSTILAVIGVFLFLAWSITILVAWSIKDRR